MPMLQLPPEVADVLRSFYTCEVTTVNRQGQPMTWPALAYFDEPNGQLFFSVSIAFPVKAQNARRHPQVSLLYSDPTGSQLTDPPAVLVQGDATVADVLDLFEPRIKGLSDLAAKRQPDSGAFSSNKVARRLFDWYLFKRIGIAVTPRRILVWSNRDFSRAPHTVEVANVE
ncbi:MAG TPA: pyridoxamine 5'-phosphate oxidase family protein [Ktedonobacterales bacterium]|nr:pyridoxamine 5'-phosphate oxidase family protein [Ktedonobacterales bacterium]